VQWECGIVFLRSQMRPVGNLWVIWVGALSFLQCFDTVASMARRASCLLIIPKGSVFGAVGGSKPNASNWLTPVIKAVCCVMFYYCSLRANVKGVTSLPSRFTGGGTDKVFFGPSETAPIALSNSISICSAVLHSV